MINNPPPDDPSIPPPRKYRHREPLSASINYTGISLSAIDDLYEEHASIVHAGLAERGRMDRMFSRNEAKEIWSSSATSCNCTLLFAIIDTANVGRCELGFIWFHPKTDKSELLARRRNETTILEEPTKKLSRSRSKCFCDKVETSRLINEMLNWIVWTYLCRLCYNTERQIRINCLILCKHFC